ncbi:MAG: PAS domain-containing protein [Reichenbachiella sp.]
MKVNNYSSEVTLIGTSKAINELIVNNNFVEALDRAAKIIGISYDNDCFISKIQYTNQKVNGFQIEHFWMKSDDEQRISHNNSLSLTIFNEMLHEMQTNGYFSYKYSNVKGEFRNHLDQPGGSKSGILIPIYIQNKIWGVFSMSDILEEREFSKGEIAVLTSLTTAMSTALSKKMYQQGLEEDLTEKTHEAQYRSQQLLSLIDNIPGVVFKCKIDKEWTMTYISQYVQELTGYSSIEFTSGLNNINFYQLMHPSDRDAIGEEINNQLKEENRYQVTYRIIHKNGSVRWFWEQGVKPVKEKMLEGCILDITEKVEANEQLLSATIETEERERSRISREIHDNLQQLLTTAHLNLQVLKKNIDLMSERDVQKFDIAFDYLQKAIGESRTISHRLMPKAIEDYGFQSAVTSMLESLDETVAVKFLFNENLNNDRLPIQIELTLYRITQEAVTNILKFSNASEANIQLIKHSNSIILTIEDNGVGFDKKEMNNFKSSFGMNGMKNRASSIGGQLYLDTSEGRGTQIMIEVPLTKLSNDQNKNSIS